MKNLFKGEIVYGDLILTFIITLASSSIFAFAAFFSLILVFQEWTDLSLIWSVFIILLITSFGTIYFLIKKRRKCLKKGLEEQAKSFALVGTFMVLLFATILVFPVIGLIRTYSREAMERKLNDKYDKFKYWSKIEIAPENQKISIYYELDTAFIVTWDWKDTIISGMGSDGKVQIKSNYRKQLFYISKKERDSLFKYTYNIVRDTVEPKSYCTDYCGHVSFSIISRQMNVSNSYNSICNWTTISKDSEKIYAILSKKAKINTSSDCIE